MLILYLLLETQMNQTPFFMEALVLTGKVLALLIMVVGLELAGGTEKK